MSKPATNTPKGETLTYACKCGRVHVCENVMHYDRFVLTGCHTRAWALQPKRNGPLELRLLPAPILTPEKKS